MQSKLSVFCECNSNKWHCSPNSFHSQAMILAYTHTCFRIHCHDYKSRRYSQWNVSMTSPCSQHTTDSPEWYKIPCKSSSDLKRLINTPHTLSCSLLTTIFFFWPQRKGLYLIIPIIMLVNNRCTGGNNVWVYQIKEMNRQCWFFTFLNR